MGKAITKPIAVIDIDGTIAEVGTRGRYFEQNPIDWDAFYRENFDDKPIANVCDFVKRMRNEYEIIFCTARRECVRQQTQEWLLKNLGFQPADYTLIMRENGDTRPDYVQKIDNFIQETTSEERERVGFVIDDSLTVATCWRLRLGYRVFNLT